MTSRPRTAVLLVLVLSVSPGWSRGPTGRAPLPPRDVETWHELLLVNRPGEVAAALPEVGFGGPLAAEGEAVALVARALVLTGELALAQELLEGAPASADAGGHVSTERARLHLLLGEPTEAVRLLAPPADSDEPVRFPELDDAWIPLARAHSELGAQDLAVELAAGLLARAPHHADAATAWHLFARDAIARGDPEAAQACLEEASASRRWQALYRERLRLVHLFPDDALPLLELARIWLEVGATGEARATLARMTTRFPEDCRGWQLLGDVDKRDGNPVTAREHYDRALRCDPFLGRARYARALLHLEAQNEIAARADLEVLMRTPSAVDPELRGAHLTLARLLDGTGLRDEAELRYAEYVRLGGESPLREGDAPGSRAPHED